MSNYPTYFELASATDTEALGATIAGLSDGPRIILLSGNLGAGKTTFARGFLTARGHTGAVKSPTFTLVETYDLAPRTVHHFDLYRITDPSELDFIGFEEYLSDGSDVLIEWPSLAGDRIGGANLTITFEINGMARNAAIGGDADILNELQRKT